MSTPTQIQNETVFLKSMTVFKVSENRSRENRSHNSIASLPPSGVIFHTVKIVYLFEVGQDAFPRKGDKDNLIFFYPL